jgi:predicted RNase H-like HicB family nuclease
VWRFKPFIMVVNFFAFFIFEEKILNNRKVMKQLTYRLLLNPEPEGGYTVTVPALPGCITWGENIDHAIEMAKEAIEVYIESMVANNEMVPDESKTLECALTLKAAV